MRWLTRHTDTAMGGCSIPDNPAKKRDIKRTVDRRGRTAHLATQVSLVLSGIGHGGVASAAQLDWQAPAPCPDRETVARRIRDAIAMPLEKAANMRFVCRVTETSDKRFRLALRVAVPGTAASPTPRIIEAPNCDQVADTAAVAIALALGADASDVASNGSEVSPPFANSSPSEPGLTAPDKPKQAENSGANSVPSESAATAQSVSSHLWVAARLGPTFDLGSLPALSFGPQIAFELGYRAVSARLSGSYFPEKQSTLADGSGGEFSLWGASLTACGTTPRARAHGHICAGVELGQMKGTGIGNLKVPHQKTTWWVTPEVDVAVVSAPWLFGMRTYIGALAGLPLARRPFTFEGTEEVVHRADPMVWRLNAGLEIDWP